MKMVMSILLRFIYGPPPSLFIKAMSVISATSLANGGVAEIRGKHMQYSKFWNVGSQNSTPTLPSKTGMLIIYTPAFLFGLASFGLFPHQGLRFMLLKSALTIHFFKRISEVLFVHKYSGPMFLDVAILISLSYFINTASMIYAQHLTQGLQEPPIDMQYAGVVMFLMGLSGNLYHHFLLSKLRDEGDTEYKVPKGGLFNLVICPHYLFEILGFIGVSCIAQTLTTCSFTLGTTILLMGRSYATRKWYLSKFEDFPSDVKVLIPFVF